VEREVLMTRLGGDVELLGELLDLFRYDAPPRMNQLRGSLLDDDAQAFARAAHGLKSGVSNFCVPEVAVMLTALEDSGRQGNLEGAAAAVEVVEVRIAEVIEELTEMCAESAA
jgi:HPt (histidine-containing phosphotransfer) domain-containing protein